MTTTQQTEFLQQHAQDGVMTPEQAAQFLELVEGDTGTKLPDTSSVPSAAPADAAASTGQAAELEPSKNAGELPPPSDVQPDPANTVILAKDGKHTIPYSKLEEARQAEQAARAAAQAAQNELAALRAQAEQRAAAGAAPTAADNASALVVKALETGDGRFDTPASLINSCASLLVVTTGSAIGREGAMILCDEQNKKSNVGTISYIPALFGIGCASVAIRTLIGEMD